MMQLTPEMLQAPERVLIEWREQFINTVESLRGDTDTVRQRKEEIGQDLISNLPTDVRDAVTALIESFEERMVSLFDAHPATATIVESALRENLLPFSRDVKDVTVDEEFYRQRPKSVKRDPETISNLKELRENITQLFAVVSQFPNVQHLTTIKILPLDNATRTHENPTGTWEECDDDDCALPHRWNGDKEIPFPTKEQYKRGEKLPDGTYTKIPTGQLLPDLPKIPEEETSGKPRGRASKKLIWRWSIDGVELPNDTIADAVGVRHLGLSRKEWLARLSKGMEKGSRLDNEKPFTITVNNKKVHAWREDIK